ncbi:hypothetical protein FF38_08764 [Lucilia cuprina]|uniref:Uncharacterized protein n=1 Tax=Lucilia cuprina TaxID=7375 RepID=A0A0L0CMX3_LUCCU|nr:hypothetical protein FF38_08764 [Lucilia cuprina]
MLPKDNQLTLFNNMLLQKYKLLNYKLQNNEVKSPIASIYMQLLKLRQEINSLYGPAIFIIFSSLILMYSISAYTLCTLWLEYHFAIFLIDMYIYVLICDRGSQTTKETTNIMLEDCTIQQNRETELLCLGRSILRPNINICGIIDIDLKYLFGIIASITQHQIRMECTDKSIKKPLTSNGRGTQKKNFEDYVKE